MKIASLFHHEDNITEDELHSVLLESENRALWKAKNALW